MGIDKMKMKTSLYSTGASGHRHADIQPGGKFVKAYLCVYTVTSVEA